MTFLAQRVFRLLKGFALAMAIVAGIVGFAAGQGQDNAGRGNAPLRIAVVMVGGNAEVTEIARSMAHVIAANLGREGQLVVLDEAQFVERITDINRLPRFADWRVINAEALVTGRISSGVGDQFRVEFRLWNITDGEHLISRQYSASADRRDAIARLISNSVYERLTGRTDAFN